MPLPHSVRQSVTQRSGRNQGAIAKDFYPRIKEACDIQIEKLKIVGGRVNQDRIMQIQLALERLNRLIALKEQISRPDVNTITQVNGEEEIVPLFKADFSNIEVLLKFRSVKWHWDEFHGEAMHIREESGPPQWRITKLSLYEALNACPENVFNWGFFGLGAQAYYPPFFGGKTKELQEVEKMLYTQPTDVKDFKETKGMQTDEPPPPASNCILM